MELKEHKKVGVFGHGARRAFIVKSPQAALSGTGC